MHVVQFRSEDQELSGRLHLPTGVPRAFALFAHCFTCTKNIRAAVAISRALADQGIATLRFDFTGLGESEGEFAETTFSSNVGDLVAAADWLRRHHRAPEILVGHSLGGAAVLAAASRIEEAKAVATVGAPADPAHVEKLFADDRETVEQRGEATVKLAGRPFRITKRFLDDLREQCSADEIANLKRALLVLHAPLDDVVGVDNARRIFEAARHPKSFISLDGADHLLSDRADAVYVGRVLSAWVTRYLPSEPSEDEDDARPRVVEVVGGREKYRQQIQAGPHRLVSDEPETVGGYDTGPSPYDLVLAGLGACTSMTLRMYADRKGWPLDEVRVRMVHGKIHASDCDECETTSGKIDDVDRALCIEGDLSDSQRERLMEIADRCPVHRTLHSEVRVRSRLLDAWENDEG